VSAAEFAAQIGVKYQTFAHWRQRRKNRQGALAVQAADSVPAALMAPQAELGPRWVEAEIETEAGNHEQVNANGSMLTAELPGGASVELSNPGHRPDVIRLCFGIDAFLAKNGALPAEEMHPHGGAPHQ